MEIRAVYENGAVSLVDSVLSKHSWVDLLAVVPDLEVLDLHDVRCQEIEVELLQLASEDDMLQKVWADFDGKNLGGTILSDSEVFVEALAMSGKY